MNIARYSWIESNAMWGGIGLLATVFAAKFDVRWLLLASLICFMYVTWKQFHGQSHQWLKVCTGWLVFGVVLLFVFLARGNPHDKEGLSANANSSQGVSTATWREALTITDVNRIVHQIGDPYYASHPYVSHDDLQTFINSQLIQQGYLFKVKLPQFSPPPMARVHLSIENVQLEDTSPDNRATAISTGDNSPVTLKNSPIKGYRNGVRTGNGSSVDAKDSPIYSSTQGGRK